MSRFPKLVFLLGLSVAAGAGSAGAVDLAAGKKVFGKCASCHAVGEDAKNKVGPELNDLIGRTAGTVEGYKYSKAMIDAGAGGLVWDEANLRAYLTKPRDLVKGTKMAFAGLKKEDELANIIGYLASFSKKAAAVEKEEPDTKAAAAEPAPAAADKASSQAASPPGAGDGLHLKLGRLATEEEVAAWDIDIRPDGLGLPKGKGTVSHGMEIYDQNCASCHGDFGEGVGRWPVLAGGQGTLRADRPEKTIGSYWPYLSTVYDYVRRAMPFGNARSLSDDDVYALTAYLLYLNDVVTDEEFELSDRNFTDIRLPNEANFIEDDRTDEPFYAGKSEPCMTNCIPGKATIKMHAAILDVTPENADEDDQPAGGID
ncbi:MAG TPA: c-type cytochrome [Pararhizobium sp.]|jgi:cytochrome c|nr:c-type cytochrome [Pararhizobium sp.]HTO34465.1 c-type cytochrome [Pararhizobium sp.]